MSELTNLIIRWLSCTQERRRGSFRGGSSPEGASIMFRAFLIAWVVVGCACVVPGCIAVGGDSQPAPTVGRELMDLKTALDRGAITPGEYEAKKTDLLARR